MMRGGATSQKRSRTNRRFCRFTKTFVCRTIPIARTVPFPNKWPTGDEGNDEVRTPNDERKRFHADRVARRHRNHRGTTWARLPGISGNPGTSQESAGEKRSHSSCDGSERVLHRIWKISDFCDY